MKKRIAIISFSQVHRDARVLRQIEYLSPYYELTVIGYGYEVTHYRSVDWQLLEPESRTYSTSLSLLFIPAGRLWPAFYERWYWRQPRYTRALENALKSGAQVYHANDWKALPVAAEAARRNGGRVVLDEHEYAPLEFENRWYWHLLVSPLVTYMLRKYAPRVDASTTVAPEIAERYRQEFGLDPIVVLNAPKLVPVQRREADPTNIRLIYHGGANPDRHLELMIETVPYLDRRYSLHFMLVGGFARYVNGLKELARKLGPGRIYFHDPVPPSEIVPRIAEYDIGFFLLKPVNYSYRVALPNKLFDFLAAGLAVCVGPSPGMSALVREHGVGCVAPSFEPREVAETLNRLTVEWIEEMREAARRAAQVFNADTEMEKVVRLYRRLLGEPGEGDGGE